jgi:hypothetical protein
MFRFINSSFVFFQGGLRQSGENIRAISSRDKSSFIFFDLVDAAQNFIPWKRFLAGKGGLSNEPILRD